MEDRSFWMILGAYTALMITALLLLFFSGYSTIDLINVAVGMSAIYVSILMVYVTAKSIEATKYVGELGIKPLVIAFIRSARSFSEEMRQIHGWMPGVGIFVESIGNGPALNGKIMCTLRGEKEERKYEMNFGRMRPGQRYTYPSISQPNLEIKETDKELIIEIEYDDALRKHHKEETTKIEIIEDFFINAPLEGRSISNNQVWYLGEYGMVSVTLTFEISRFQYSRAHETGLITMYVKTYEEPARAKTSFAKADTIYRYLLERGFIGPIELSQK